MGFCCPVNKVIRLNTEKIMTTDNEESDLDKILDLPAPEPIKPLPEEPECGQNTKSLSNNMNVQNAEANDWPWMAVFLETTNYMNFCGGVLLNRRFVLTAAHCFIIYSKENVVVRLGEYDFTTDNETQYIDYRVTDIRLHPDYDHATHANDIAIVRLNRPTIYNSFIRPICLPKTNMEVYNRNAVVAGWGQTVYGGKVSNVLQEVTVPIWDHDQCVSAFSQPISRTNLCAASYEGGKDSCLGDSGGPLLMQRHDGKWTNAGVVSWGIKCGGIGIPGVYTKVTSYLKWIAVNAQDVISIKSYRSKMLLMKNVDVYSLPLYALLVVGFHAAAGQLVRVKLEKDTSRSVQVCRQDTECVSGFEFCDINLGPEKRPKCGLGNELSKSFCCPVDKVIRSKRDRRMTNDDDESDLDKVLDRAAPEPIKPLVEELECGQNTKSISKITKVQNAKASDWPWMAVFLETTNYMNFCGGALLNRRFVLTAAHCFKKFTKQNFVVRLGEYDFTSNNETQYIDYRVTDIRIHPDYDQATHANDIAILRLNRPTIYNSFIRPICLPKTNMEVYKKTAVVAGWGQTVFGGEVSNVLQEVAIPIWEHDQCVSAFSQPIFKTNLCAASFEGGKDSCLGDSGGPLLMQRQDGKWTNVGVVSWGISCGEVGYPGVYTKVTSYLKWIAVNAQDVI
ncbi:serine protease persephone-like [Myzus persicae]|uniref:serine protease persephone-like n=1 Tax=Myzus persicae TaxID=13164 RepID=UPI000B9364F6|nr:serine protease persephone-like [Myzus persicae]